LAVEVRRPATACAARHPLSESDWRTFQRKIDIEDESEFDRGTFDGARVFVREQLSELKPDEAMLVSIG
jgi:hypothetical protein